jgi:hypothetical protein
MGDGKRDSKDFRKNSDKGTIPGKICTDYEENMSRIFSFLWPVSLSLMMFHEAGCSKSSQTGTNRARTQVSDAAVDDTDKTQDSAASESEEESNSDTNGDSNTGTGDEVAEITEEQALGIIEASCLAANCHATTDELLASAQLLERIEDGTMPPTNQSRYTLSDEKRAELVLYLQSQSS